MSKHQTYPPTPFYERLTELSKLKDGWLDGYGKALSAEALKSASVLGAALPSDVVLRVCPTEAGGVSLEWDDQHGGHEIEVLPDGHLFLMTTERTEEPTRKTVPAEYVQLKGQLEADLQKMAACAAQPPRPGAEEVRAMQGGIAAGICSSLARAIQCFEGSAARGAFLKRVEGDR